VSHLAESQGLPATVFWVRAEQDDTLLFGTNVGLYRRSRGEITRAIAGSKDARMPFSAGWRDSHGRLWVASLTGPGYIDNGRFVAVPSPPGVVRAFAQDRGGLLWAASQDAGLLQMDATGVVRQLEWSAFAHNDFATALTADPRNGIWLGFYE